MLKELFNNLISTSEFEQSKLNSILLVGFSTLVFYFIIYPLYFHPLSNIPGPKICSLTKYYILYISWSEQRNRYVQKLHEQYGSIVRIGPNEIDINDIKYQKDIYVGNFDKSSFYAQFVNYDEPNTFSTQDKKQHIQSRKVSHKFYSKTNICSENIMSKIVTVMTATLKVFDEYNKESIDVFNVFCNMAMDAVTSFSFGKGNYDSLLADTFGKGNQIVKEFGLQSSTGFWVTEMPYFYDYVATDKVIEASNKCYKWIENQFLNAFNNINETIEQNEETLLTVYFDYDKVNGKVIQKSPIFTKNRTKSEFFDHIAAGHVTTGTTLSYFFYELAKNPKIQKKIQKELIDTLNNGKPIESSNHIPFDYSLIDDEYLLPYTHATLLETFRLRAAIPGQEPRIVPSKGMIFNGNENVKPCKIPGGTTIVMQPWSLHRVSTLFPDPDTFNPDRWLDASDEQYKLMKANLMHFGAGSRMCIGLNLATAEMKIILTSFLCRYNITLDDKFNYDYDGEMLDIYTTVPRSEQMVLKFTPILSS